MGASEAIKITNGGASASSSGALIGGVYMFVAVATWGGGSAKIQMLSGDGSNYVDIPNGSLTDNGCLGPFYLPPGTYKITTATATAIYASLTRSPLI